MFREVPTDQAQALLTSVMGAFEAGDRLQRQRDSVTIGREVENRGFTAMSPEAHAAACSKGGKTPRIRTGPRANAMKRYGLTIDEYWDYGAIRAKGFSETEAAEIILRSRKAR